MTNAIRINGTQTLSTDLNVVSAEIDMRQSLIGESIFEIGRRLKHVKELDLTHGQYMPWLAERKIEHTVATRMIKAYEQFGDVATSQGLDTSKIYEMLSLPAEVDRADFIQTPHEIPSTGETKVVDDMTVKELREVKAELKKTQAERDAEREAREQAVASESVAMELLSGVEDDLAEAKAQVEMVQAAAESAVAVEVEPVVIEKEVIPVEFQRKFDEMKAAHQQVESERDALKYSQADTYEELQRLKKNERARGMQEESPLYDVYRSSNVFRSHADSLSIDEAYTRSLIAGADAGLRSKLLIELKAVQLNAARLIGILELGNGSQIIEAEYTDTVVGQTTIYDAEIIEVEVDKPLTRAEEKMLTVLVELTEGGDVIRVYQIAEKYGCDDRNVQTHLKKPHVIAAYESLGIIRRGSAATEYIFQKVYVTN